MSAPTHTPGPWELSYDKGSTRDVIASNGSEPICIVRQSWVSREAYYANARLIAAAPDLFCVLKELQECAEYWSEYDVPLGIIDRINSVIARCQP